MPVVRERLRRSSKRLPACGSRARDVLAQLRPRRRDVEGVQIGSAEDAARDLTHRQGELQQQLAAGRVPAHAPAAPDRDPDRAFRVDGAGRPERRPRVRCRRCAGVPTKHRCQRRTRTRPRRGRGCRRSTSWRRRGSSRCRSRPRSRRRPVPRARSGRGGTARPSAARRRVQRCRRQKAARRIAGAVVQSADPAGRCPVRVERGDRLRAG